MHCIYEKKTFFSNLDPYLNFCVYKTSLLNFNLKRNICFEIRAIVTYYRPYFLFSDNHHQNGKFYTAKS